MSTDEPIRFSREFKLEALRRMEAGENVSVLARELGVSRKSIYQWRNRYSLAGSMALRGRGRRTKAEVSAHGEKPPTAQKQPARVASTNFVGGTGAGGDMGNRSAPLPP